MKKGDILKIKGSLGFLWNPEMKVIEVKNEMVLLEPKDCASGGILSHLNQSWHGLDLIKDKLI